MKAILFIPFLLIFNNAVGQLIPTVGVNNNFNLTSGQTTTFHDPNGTGGAPCTTGTTASGSYDNCACFTTTTICAAVGEFITTDFTEFSMWNTTSGWDWMKIYDGPTTASIVIFDNSSTGPDNPIGDCGLAGGVLPFCSTGQCLTFEFYATSVVNRGGWDANVSSVALQCTPLPVELERFRGEDKGEYNLLSWITVSEINNDYFQVQRSRGGQFWEDIGKIQGNGTISTPAMYEFKDDSYISGTNYYRLVQYDYNGASDTSNIVVINTIPQEEGVPTIYTVDGRKISKDKAAQFVGVLFYRYDNGYVRAVIKKSKKN